jgi:hypothetical protein
MEWVREGVLSPAEGVRRGLGGCSGAVLGLNGRRGLGCSICGLSEAIVRVRDVSEGGR